MANPRDAESLFKRGMLFYEQDRFDAAMGCFDEVLEIEHDNPDAWVNKGFCLCNLGRHEEGIGCFDNALDIDPQCAEAWHNKGLCLSKLGRFPESLEYFKTALRINPQFAEAWFEKAFAEDNLNCKEDAVRSYQRFLGLAPSKYAQEIHDARARVQELQQESRGASSESQSPATVEGRPKVVLKFGSDRMRDGTVGSQTYRTCPSCQGTGRQKIIQRKTVMEPQTAYEQVTQFQFGRPVRVTVPRTVMKPVQRSQYLMVVCPRCKGSGKF